MSPIFYDGLSLWEVCTGQGADAVNVLSVGSGVSTVVAASSANTVTVDTPTAGGCHTLTSGTNGAGTTPLNQVSGKLILLTPKTLHADSSPDTLIGCNQTDPATGKRAHNWFFYDFDDVIVNVLTSSDHMSHNQTKLGLEKLAILALLTGPITSPRPASPAAISNQSFDYRPARLAGWS